MKPHKGVGVNASKLPHLALHPGCGLQVTHGCGDPVAQSAPNALKDCRLDVKPGGGGGLCVSDFPIGVTCFSSRVVHVCRFVMSNVRQG